MPPFHVTPVSAAASAAEVYPAGHLCAGLPVRNDSAADATPVTSRGASPVSTPRAAEVPADDDDAKVPAIDGANAPVVNEDAEAPATGAGAAPPASVEVGTNKSHTKRSIVEVGQESIDRFDKSIVKFEDRMAVLAAENEATLAKMYDERAVKKQKLDANVAAADTKATANAAKAAATAAKAADAKAAKDAKDPKQKLAAAQDALRASQQREKSLQVLLDAHLPAREDEDEDEDEEEEEEEEEEKHD